MSGGEISTTPAIAAELLDAIATAVVYSRRQRKRVVAERLAVNGRAATSAVSGINNAEFLLATAAVLQAEPAAECGDANLMATVETLVKSGAVEQAAAVVRTAERRADHFCANSVVARRVAGALPVEQATMRPAVAGGLEISAPLEDGTGVLSITVDLPQPEGDVLPAKARVTFDPRGSGFADAKAGHQEACQQEVDSFEGKVAPRLADAGLVSEKLYRDGREVRARKRRAKNEKSRQMGA